MKSLRENQKPCPPITATLSSAADILYQPLLGELNYVLGRWPTDSLERAKALRVRNGHVITTYFFGALFLSLNSGNEQNVAT